jgi:hypothetical protein
MILLQHSTRNRRRGIIAVLVVLCLAVLLGVAALALDGGMALAERRRAQDVADAAALAAAADLFAKYQSNHGQDVNGTAAASALSIAAANRYRNDGTQSVVTVRVSPAQPVQPDLTITDSSGNLKPGYAEVIVQYNEPRFFSGIWGQGTIPIVGRAVARGTWITIPEGVILLDPTSAGALTAKGNGGLTVTGGSVIVNSSDPSGATAVGNATLTAPAFEFAGTPGYSTNGNAQFNGTINSGATPVADPLAYLTPPDPSQLVLQHAGGLHITADNSVTLNPGVYRGGIQITGKGGVTLNSGVYYMDGGGFSITGQGALSGNGVLIYNAPATSSDAINLAGQGRLSLTPMSTGAYQGISLFQDRTSSATISIKGNGSVNIIGTVYAASSTLDVTGNGSGDVIGSQFIGYDMSLKGNGDVTIKICGPVARTRKFGLVE